MAAVLAGEEFMFCFADLDFRHLAQFFQHCTNSVRFWHSAGCQQVFFKPIQKTPVSITNLNRGKTKAKMKNCFSLHKLSWGGAFSCVHKVLPPGRQRKLSFENWSSSSPGIQICLVPMATCPAPGPSPQLTFFFQLCGASQQATEVGVDAGNRLCLPTTPSHVTATW